MTDRKLAIIAGAGAGLGAALMRRIQSHGLRPVGLSRSGASGADLDIRGCDLADPDEVMKPDEIAEVYWQLSQQPQSVWTHEIDLRPSSETF